MNLLIFLLFIKAFFTTNPLFVSDNWEKEYMNNLCDSFVKVSEEVFDRYGR